MGTVLILCDMVVPVVASSVQCAVLAARRDDAHALMFGHVVGCVFFPCLRIVVDMVDE